MTIIVNGTLVTPDGERRTSLAVEDGKIKMIGEIDISRIYRRAYASGSASRGDAYRG